MTVASIVSVKHANGFFSYLWLWPLWPWPSVKVTVCNMLWSALWLSTSVPNLLTVASIVSEKHANVSFSDLLRPWPSVNVTKRIVAKYLCDKFNKMVTVASIVSEKHSNFFLPLTLRFVTLTFGQGHSVWYVVKRIAAKCLCTKLGDCSFNSFEACQCLFFWLMTLTFVTLTLGRCHHVYHQKRVVAKYLDTIFGDCSYSSFRKKFHV